MVMRVRIVTPNYVDERYEGVLQKMARLGPPRIRAVRVAKNLWHALEGSHRIHAAKKLGLPILLVEKWPYERIRHSRWSDLASGKWHTVQEMLDEQELNDVGPTLTVEAVII